MENIALSDSNDDLTHEIIGDNNPSRPPPRMVTEQQHVTSELQDAANTDVIKGILIDIKMLFFFLLRLILYFKPRLLVLLILHLNLCFQHRIVQLKFHQVVLHYYFNRQQIILQH
jgi:hypothetical protein